MSAVLITIGRLNSDGRESLERYATAVIPLIRQAGGEILCRLRPTETVVGPDAGRPDLVAVMRFPTADAIRAFLDSHTYREQVPHRHRAFVEIRSFLAEDLL